MAERHKLNLDPYAKPSKEEDFGSRHPSRYEPTQSTIKPSQADALDATQVQRVNAVSLSTGTTITWDTVGFDTQGLWNGSTTFTIPSSGKITGPWLFHAKVTWPGTGAGSNRQIDLLQNGSAIATMQGPAATTGQQISRIVYNPNRGDTFTVKVTQDSGGALTMTVGAAQMFFEVVHPW